MRRTWFAIAVLALAGCGGAKVRTATTPLKVKTAPHTISVSSPALAPGASIPRAYTCDGRDGSPPLRWSGVPAGTRELALEMIDLDAPGGPFLHWALAGIRPSLMGLAPGPAAPAGVFAGRNGFGKIGYRGPCPPPGKRHRYVIALFALPAALGLRPGFAAGALPTSRALALGELEGTYGHP